MKAKPAVRNNAVFLGWRGQYKYAGEGCFMPNAYPTKLPLRKDGSVINPFETGKYLEPELDPEFLRWDYYLLYPGRSCYVPSKNEALMAVIKESKEFASIELAEMVSRMYDQGATGEEVFNAVKALGGLIADPEEEPEKGKPLAG